MIGDEESADDESGEGELEAPAKPDVGTPRGQKARDQQIRLVKAESERFWRESVLGDPIGRRELWALLGDAHTFEKRMATTPTGFPDPRATDYYDGERDWGLRLYHKLIVLDFEAVALMHREHDNRFKPVIPPTRARMKRKKAGSGL